MSLRWIPKWIERLIGDDRNMLAKPVPMHPLRCMECHREVTFIEKALDKDEWLHSDDASPICQPIGLYVRKGASV